MKIPSDIPPDAVGFLHEMGYLAEDLLQVGDSAPQVTLFRLGIDEFVRVGSAPTVFPTVLIFGSYT